MKILPIKNAFICLRPDIFGHPNEHVTLEYIGHKPELDMVQYASKGWMETFAGLPVTVKVNGYANWRAKDDYHSVALIEFVEYPDLSFSKNWHITLESSRQPVEARQFNIDADAFRYDYADQLWLGYKDEEGNKRFMQTELLNSIAINTPMKEYFV